MGLTAWKLTQECSFYLHPLLDILVEKSQLIFAVLKHSAHKEKLLYPNIKIFLIKVFVGQSKCSKPFSCKFLQFKKTKQKKQLDVRFKFEKNIWLIRWNRYIPGRKTFISAFKALAGAWHQCCSVCFRWASNTFFTLQWIPSIHLHTT